MVPPPSDQDDGILSNSASVSPSAATTTTAITTPLKSRQTAWWQTSVVRRSSSAVDDAVDELTEKSRFLLKRKIASYGRSNSSDSAASNENDQIARFHRDEIVTGQLLGEGTFSVVYQVVGFDLRKSKRFRRLSSFDDDDDNDNDEEDGGEENGDSYDEEESWTSLDSLQNNLRQEVVRHYCSLDETSNNTTANNSTSMHPEENTTTAVTATAHHCHRNYRMTRRRRSYALKHLKPDLLVNSKDFEQAATDLVMEGRYLAYLDHPNILKLRGWALGGTAAFSSSGYHGYFLLTDRLQETLATRIGKWKRNNDNATNTVLHKSRYALQICSALSYLHQQRIIFRDLKPSNMGFIDEHTIQLFDFGLCRELERSTMSSSSRSGISTRTAHIGEEDVSSSSYDEDVHGNEQYQDDNEKLFLMSGAGTLCYMAPECLRENRYNLKADVYSWAMTYYEMLMLAKPFPSYTAEEHLEYVVVDGDRPPLYQDDGEQVLPRSIQHLLEQAWTGDVAERLTMRQVGRQLRDIVQALEQAAKGEQPSLLYDDDSMYEDEQVHAQFGVLTLSHQKLRSLFNNVRSCCGFLHQWCRPTVQVVRAKAAANLSTLQRLLNRLWSCLSRRREIVCQDIQLANGVDVTEEDIPHDMMSSQVHRQSLLLKRKPSSVSTTTAMTDDEKEDEEPTGGRTPSFNN